MIVKPDLPGSDITFAGANTPRIAPSAAQTVAIPIIHDWGPVGSDPPGPDGKQGGPQECLSFADFTTTFGDSDTPGRTAVAGAFAGQGLPGFPGAGGVIVWRMNASSGAHATVTLTSRGTGAPALMVLTAVYSGSRGNRISYTLDDDPNNAGHDRLIIYFDGVLQEVYLRGSMTIGAFIALITATSALVNASLAGGALTGSVVRLTAASVPVNLTAGDDGAGVVSSDHLAALAGLQYKQFGVIAPYDLTSSPIQTSYQSWVDAQVLANRPVRLVLGGAAGEDVTAAVARAQAMNDEHVVMLGGGTYHDDLLGKDLSTSQLAPRIAGIIAAKGDSHAVTFAKIGGLHTVVGIPESEFSLAKNNGVTILEPCSASDAELRVLKGVTTYTSDTPTKPLDVFGDPRCVGVLDSYVRAMKTWGDEIIIGDLPVNDDTRALVRGHATTLNNDLLRAGLVLPANPNTNPPIPQPWVVCEDPNDLSLEDTIPYTFGFRLAKTANNIIGQGAVA